MGHRRSSRSDDDTSKFRRFGFTLVVDPDYVLALYGSTHTHTIPYRLGGSWLAQGGTRRRTSRRTPYHS